MRYPSFRTSGNFYLSYVDPVVIGRGVFHSTNDFVSGVVGVLRDSLCAVVDYLLDMILDIRKGVYVIFKYYFLTYLTSFTHNQMTERQIFGFISLNIATL